jgi:hypothetical protein
MIMEKHPITISHDNEVHHFEVSEQTHHDSERCKYRVFENGAFVAGFEPDAQNFLHICQNAAGLDDDLYDQLMSSLQVKKSA